MTRTWLIRGRRVLLASFFGVAKAMLQEKHGFIVIIPPMTHS